MKHIWNAAAVAFTNAATPYWAHSCIFVVTDIHHLNTLWIDSYESNAECYCLEVTVINVALNKTNTSAWFKKTKACFYDCFSKERKRKSAHITMESCNNIWSLFCSQKYNTCLLFSLLQYPFGENMETSLLQPLEASLQTTTHTYCGRASHLFTRKLKESIMSVQQDVTEKMIRTALWLVYHDEVETWR